MIEESAIIKMVSEQSGTSESHITSKSMLREDCNLSPMEIVDLVTTLSHQYKIVLPEDVDMESIVTINDLHEFLIDLSSEM